MKIVYKSYFDKTGQEITDKIKKLKARYPFPITGYTTGRGLIIRPCLDRDIKPNSKHAETILNYLEKFGKVEAMNGIPFNKISDDLKIPIIEVLECAQYLIKTAKVSGDVGRVGGCVGIHIYRI